jgi:tRNA A37 threonylcarbamoyladenosine dehydratase
VRQRLRRRNVDIQKVKCVYSDEPAQQQAILLSDTEGKRNTLGSLPTITAIFGLTIANEVIKTLVNKGK